MAEYTDNYERGQVLMQAALKKYEEGDFEGGNRDRELANKYFDMAEQEINSEEGVLTQLYGENRNFGVIYNVLEQNIDKIVDNKKLIKEIISTIKNDKILNEEFKIYDLFENSRYGDDVKRFVTEALSLIKPLNQKRVKASNEKLIKLMRENKFDEYVFIPSNMEKFYESIEYAILNKDDINKIDRVIEAQNVIIEHISKNNAEINENKQDFDSFKKLLHKTEEEVNEELNSDEKMLIEQFTNPQTDKKLMFEQIKQDALNKIREVMNLAENTEVRQEWQNVYENLMNKTYDEKNALVEMAKIIETTNTLNE